MPQPRIIQATDAKAWLEVLFDYALFSKNNCLELDALLEILGIGYESAGSPNPRLPELLLSWASRHVDQESWERLSLSVHSRWEYYPDSQTEALELRGLVTELLTCHSGKHQVVNTSSLVFVA